MRCNRANRLRPGKPARRFIVLLPALAVLLAGCFYRPAASHQPKVVGVVTRATGAPSIVRRNANYLIGVESRIYEGDIVQTGEASRARIRMIDRSVIRLGNDSHLVIHRYDFTAGDSSPSARLTFTSGALQIDTVGFARAKHPDFRIQTPLAAITLNSTRFWAGFIFGDKRLDVVLLQGKKVQVTNDQGSVELTAPGLGTTVIAGGTPQVPVEWNAGKRNRATGATAI